MCVVGGERDCQSTSGCVVPGASVVQGETGTSLPGSGEIDRANAQGDAGKRRPDAHGGGRRPLGSPRRAPAQARVAGTREPARARQQK